MKDPWGPPSGWLLAYAEPVAERLGLGAMPPHIHQGILALAFYQTVQSVVSPAVSRRLFPKIYPNLPPRTKLNWDIHVVSLLQSIFISTLAWWVIAVDDERWAMKNGERVFGYSGACGLVAAMAAGYFSWDFIVSTIHIRVFGIGMFLHACSAICVYSLGNRPLFNYYSPTFVLYELSSPFLNIHWFLDKLNMTGSNFQWYNGILLLGSFFSCRLVWGTWQSYRFQRDLFSAYLGRPGFSPPVAADAAIVKHNSNGAPTWFFAAFGLSNIILNLLNWYWFSHMIDAVMKRFRGPVKEVKADGKVESEPVKMELAEVDTPDDPPASQAVEQNGIRQRKP